MGQKYAYIVGGLLALHLGNSAWSKDTFCDTMCESGKGIWCQLDFIHKGCQEKCDASKLAACNQQNTHAKTNKVKLTQALGALKNTFCKFSCTSGACAASKAFGGLCLDACPKDTVVNCKKAYEGALEKKKLEEKPLLIIEKGVSPGPRIIQNMGPNNIPPYRKPIQNMGPDNIPPYRKPLEPLDTNMRPPPTVPIHGMGASPEIVSEQPVPEAYRTIPDRRIDY
ncbi:MAG: hypothetical protein ACRCYP_07295 [Alphaproteobacteria bacterium]